MPALAAGTRLDHYEIQDLVARSGSTSIYRAIDLNTDRPVAIKIPHAEIEGDLQFYNRFCRERAIGEKLDHPGVAKIIAEEDPSRLYIAAEWADGELLRKMLNDETRVPVERALMIALSICDVLAYVHSQGVVHRDLKPENIVVDAQNGIKLIDFGIASQAGASRLTFGKLSSVMGSPSYISPEQVQGKRGDARSDLYALGVILYEMLTGKMPFTGRDPFAVMNSRLVNDPIPPRKLAPEMPEELAAILDRALERDPKRRYQTAHEFARDLRDPHLAMSRQNNLPPEPRSWASPFMVYCLLAAIPALIFGFLLYVARQGH